MQMSEVEAVANIGLIGLAVMGQNLALNMADNGYTVAVYNRTTETMTDFVASATGDQKLVGAETLEELVACLERPRKIMLMVKAGPIVDTVIDSLIPLLEEGDIIIDGGNSLYTDTEVRVDRLAEAGLLFVGAGVSGGEVGARFGPSIMPGGAKEAWPEIKDLFEAIAATAGEDDEPTTSWVGNRGAGHFVKMVHNGIEYGDMQVLSEATALLRGLGNSPSEISETFHRWNEGRLDSYLVEISAEILDAVDEDGTTPMIDVVLDAAGQKGTGKWTVISAMQIGQPMMLVAEAVGARIVSSFVEMRAKAETILSASVEDIDGITTDDVEAAVYASKLISYTQGFMMMGDASTDLEMNLDLAAIARLWRAGSIIRARFLDDIADAYGSNPNLENLLFNDHFASVIVEAEVGLRKTVVAAAKAGIAIPTLASALTFYDGLRKARGTAGLIQAQRDYFGAHTYERVDRPRGEFFHTDWAGTGGTATSGSYSA